MNPRIPASLALAAAALLSASGAAAAGTLDLVDAMGRSVRIATPRTRIASLSPSATEILFAIGAADAVAGVSRHCDFPVAAKLKPRLGDFNSPDSAKLLEAGADLALFTEYVRTEDLKELEEAGIPALVLPAATVADIVRGVLMLGEITGRAEAATALAGRLVAGIDGFRRRFAGLGEAQRPRVYVEVDGPRKLYGVGPGSFMDELVRLAGGRNAFADRGQAYFPVEPQEVVAADPEVILVDHPFQYKVGVGKREGWSAMAAVRGGRVYDGTDFDIVLLNRPGPRVLEALGQIAPLLHPGGGP